MEGLIDGYVTDGAPYEAVPDAAMAAIGRLREMHDHDPDPADDQIKRDPEPSNDWTAGPRLEAAASMDNTTDGELS